MGFKTDIEIAQECEMKPITEIAEKAGIDDKYLEQYGKYKAKIDYNLLKESNKENGKLILVTAINPTPAGEGKTTTTVGLADAMQKMGKSVMVALREPSLGPVFGCLLYTSTTHGSLYTLRILLTCFRRFGRPFSSASRFSLFRSAFGTPPLYFSARTVATITTAFGFRPAIRHLISRNFSAPRSAPKPASVMV